MIPDNGAPGAVESLLLAGGAAAGRSPPTSCRPSCSRGTWQRDARPLHPREAAGDERPWPCVALARRAGDALRRVAAAAGRSTRRSPRSSCALLPAIWGFVNAIDAWSGLRAMILQMAGTRTVKINPGPAYVRAACRRHGDGAARCAAARRPSRSRAATGGLTSPRLAATFLPGAEGAAMAGHDEVAWARLTAAEIQARAAPGTVVDHPRRLGRAARPASGDRRGHVAGRRDGGAHGAAGCTAAGTQALVTPCLWSGLAEHHMPFGGTITLDVRRPFPRWSGASRGRSRGTASGASRCSTAMAATSRRSRPPRSS